MEQIHEAQISELHSTIGALRQRHFEHLELIAELKTKTQIMAEKMLDAASKCGFNEDTEEYKEEDSDLLLRLVDFVSGMLNDGQL